MDQLIKYFNDGGIFMWPLLACSLVAVAVIIERAIRLRRAVLIDPNVVEDIQNKIEQGKIDLAVATYQNSSVLVGRVLAKGLHEYANTTADIETSLLEAGNRGLQVLSNNLAVLTTVARVATLLGLLGTVAGMIMGFEELARPTLAGGAGIGKQALAKAIGVALITTFAGLLIAVPTIVADAYFRSRIRRLLAEFEEVFIDVIKTVKAAGKTPHLHGREGGSNSTPTEAIAGRSGS